MVKGNRTEINSSESERLDAVISLLYEISDKLSEKNASIKEKVIRLARLGVDNQSIASILGISEKHVSKEKSLMKDKNE